MVWHVRAWQATQGETLEQAEFDFRRRQFRRRTQTSAMLGMLAVAILIGQLISGPGWLRLAYWGAVVLVVFWAALLAIIDAWATKSHYGRLQQQLQLEQAKLQAELRRTVGSGDEETKGEVNGTAS